MASEEGRKVVAQFMSPLAENYSPDMALANITVKRLVSSFPPEAAKMFIGALEQIKL